MAFKYSESIIEHALDMEGRGEDCITCAGDSLPEKFMKEIEYVPPAPWCVYFVRACFYWAYAANNDKAPCDDWGGDCITLQNNIKLPHVKTTKPEPGAIVIFCDPSPRGDHMGICTSVDSDTDTMTTVEGNTDGNKSFKGGRVLKHERPIDKCLFLIGLSCGLAAWVAIPPHISFS